MGDEREALRAENRILRARLAEREEVGGPAAGFLESVLAAVPAFVCRMDRALEIRYINQLQPGLRMEQVIGRTPFDFMPAEHHAVARASYERVLRDGIADRYEVAGVGPHGRQVLYETYVTPVREPDGSRGLCMMSFDVTADRERQTALEESELRLRVALAATGVGLWSWDLQEGRVEWDARMREMCGSDEPLSIEHYVSELVHPEDRAAVTAAARRGMKTGVIEPSQHRIVRPDGEVRWVLTTGTIFAAAGGPPLRLVGGTIDVTSQRAVEEQLRQAQKMEAIGSLTAGVAHNFNNLLMAILPTLGLLAPVVPGSHQDLLSDATTAAKRAAELVRGLMTFAGQRRGGSRVPSRPEDVTAEAVSICRRAFDRAIAVELEVEPDLPAISCDSGAIEQVVLNVLLNARDSVVEAGHSRSTIRVSLRRCCMLGETAADAGLPPAQESTQGHVCIEVKDEGVGMSEATRQKIFEPFFTTKGAQGTGLGLSTAWAIVRDHGGTLRCTSALGVGTTVRIVLPGAERRQPATADDAPRAAGGGSAHVLLVDDEDAVRRVVARALRTAGFACTTVDGHARARAVIEEGARFGVVLLDRCMPDGSGASLVPFVRERLPGARVLYFTGQHVEDDERERVDGVVAKPASSDALVAAIEAALATPGGGEAAG